MEWLRGRGLPNNVHMVLGLFAPLLVLCANMWHVHTFTVDDAYISFRYAVNFADGHGLVYNIGEPVEGYTNFLWTVVLGVGIKAGIDPHITSKVLGGLAAIGTAVLCYRLSARILPYRTLPCVATWLLASSPTFSGYAVFGLETAAFTFLIVLGLALMFDEVETPTRFPMSGLVFALAALTRPEAPMVLGLAMIGLGRAFVGKQNLIRGSVFSLVVLAHLTWRHSFYGAWVPATFAAKTGNLAQQWKAGTNYVDAWMELAGPIVFFALYAAAWGVTELLPRARASTAASQKSPASLPEASQRAGTGRELLSLSLIFAGICLYVAIVGGDWMSFFRFMAPAEPFCFILVGVALRRIVEFRHLPAILALVVFGVYAGNHRFRSLAKAQKKWMKEEKKFWEQTAGQAAGWLLRHGQPGRIAIGDIGYVGYKTNYPLLDLLGLVDPEIGKLPGGYTQKHGKGYRDRVFTVLPEYIIIILSGQNCDKPVMKGSRELYTDRRFKPNYAVAHNIQVSADASWCIFQRKDFGTHDHATP